MSKRQLVAISAIILTIFIINSSFRSGGGNPPCDAPLIGGGYTSAPGDGSCANAGCHSGTINSGPGVTTFMINNGESVYQPGDTLNVYIRVVEASINKFGFQVIALNDSDNTLIGEYILTEPSRTRQINAGFRKYVGSTPCGSDAATTDSIEWTFDWVAPTNDEGTVTFYLNTLSTNHNHSGSGDNTYSKSLAIAPTTGTGINVFNGENKNLTIYPNPVRDNFVIEYTMASRGRIEIILYDHQGKEVEILINEIKQKGIYTQRFSLNEKLAPGMYLVRARSKNRSNFRKFIVQ